MLSEWHQLGIALEGLRQSEPEPAYPPEPRAGARRPPDLGPFDPPQAPQEPTFVMGGAPAVVADDDSRRWKRGEQIQVHGVVAPQITQDDRLPSVAGQVADELERTQRTDPRLGWEVRRDVEQSPHLGRPAPQLATYRRRRASL